MSELRVQAFAVEIRNYNGGWKGKTKWETHEEELTLPGPDGKPVTRTEKVLQKVHYDEKQTGSDYIIYNCPKCGKRNKRCAYDAKVEDKGNVLVFRCNGCFVMVEVKRPIHVVTADEGVVYPSTGLVGLDGREIK
jgi:transcription elongation factor Elf1